MVEKEGGYDDNQPEIVYQQGNIINMHLLTSKGNNKSKTTIYCHEDSVARVVPLDHTMLAKMLEEDKEELMPLFLRKTVYQTLILQNKSFDQFMELT